MAPVCEERNQVASTSRHIRKAPLAFTFMAASHASLLHSCSGPSPSERALIPATLKSASILPNRLKQAATLSRMPSASRTSAALKSASGNSAARARHSSSFMPTTNTLACAPQRRAVAAAIPDDPVTRSTSLTSSLLFKEVFEALAMGLIERFQLLGGAGISDELVARQQNRLNAPRQQRFGSGTANHVDNGCASDGGNRAGAPFQSR